VCVCVGGRAFVLLLKYNINILFKPKDISPKKN